MTANRSPGKSMITRLYDNRFSSEELAFKKEMWTVLVEDFFQRYIDPCATVLDLGAGSCEFLNAVRCKKKIAVDLNPETAAHAQGAEVLQVPSDDLKPVEDGSVDVVFASNFFEHLPDKKTLLLTLSECRRVLGPSGKLILLQPNIRYLAGRYWDYFDHHTPLSHLSMVEALDLSGFRAIQVVPRFLPYTVKSRLPRSASLLRLYLRVPIAWRLLGRQMLIVANLDTV